MKFLCIFLGVLFEIFAVVDFLGMFFHYDITGVRWSPLVAGGIGGWLIKVGGSADTNISEDGNDSEQQGDNAYNSDSKASSEIFSNEIGRAHV